MTNKKFLVLLIVSGLIYILLESLVLESPLKVAIEVLLFIGVVVISAIIGRQAYKARKNRDASNKKVEIVKAKHETPLSKIDITILKKKMNRKMAAVIFTFLLTLCVYMVISYFLLPALFGQLGEYLFWILSAAICLVAVYLFGKHIHKLRQDIRSGKKLVVVGNVSHWEHYPYNDNDYVLYVDDIGFRVNSSVFEKYAKGDAIEVHLFEPWKNMVLFEKKLENRT